MLCHGLLEYSSSLGPWLCKMFVLNWSGSDNRENVPMIISFFLRTTQ